MLIYLADLTHTGQIVASNVMPLGIGLIGANILKEIPSARVELFKYPDDLDRALSREVPDVVGFSNYSWSCYLGMAYAKRIKATWPKVVVIAGGPNYGSTKQEQEDYWERFGEFVDFYIYKEGERSTVALLQGIEAPGTHFLDSYGDIHRNPPGDRIKSLDELPSPYASGLMDKFFDNVLIPLIHTTRGCPFKCSFCTEGTAYYDKVAKRSNVESDLQYIGQRRGELRDLYISDANFGMFKEDATTAHHIAKAQADYGWPEYIHVSGGKNHKERLLDVAGIIGGKMGVAASLQSTNPEVLANVRRSNISLPQLLDVARRGSRIDANTYAEIILNLPGDTRAAHTQSLRDAVNSGLSYLRMYQLIMLPETDMNTEETRARFGMKTMWRIMPRCFGRYSFQGETFACAEVEEICIAQHSLSFEDYIECRELDLTVEIFHNTGLFREIFGVCQVEGVEWFDVLMDVHEKRRPRLASLYDLFRENTVKPLFATRDEALDFAQRDIDAYLTEQLGTNELFNTKAIAFFEQQEELHDVMYRVARKRFPHHADYLDEARAFSLGRKGGLLDRAVGTTHDFSYDFGRLLEMDFSEDPRHHRRNVTLTFGHQLEQRQTIEQFVRQYGTSHTGLGRILLRAHIKKLFRTVQEGGEALATVQDTGYRRASNLYGD